ncbi:MAG: protein TolA, partial [Reyranella sp.]|nr:protein TolA [Reyranella sp.]
MFFKSSRAPEPPGSEPPDRGDDAHFQQSLARLSAELARRYSPVPDDSPRSAAATAAIKAAIAAREAEDAAAAKATEAKAVVAAKAAAERTAAAEAAERARVEEKARAE